MSDDHEVGHVAGASHLSVDGLLGPVVPTHTSSRQPTRCAHRQPDVERDSTPSPAEVVGLSAALTEQSSTLNHWFAGGQH